MADAKYTGVVHGSNNGVAPVVFTVPGGLTAGSWMLATLVDTGAAAMTIAAPSGWTTLLARVKVGTRFMTVFGKRYAASDGATITFTQSTTSACTGSIAYGSGGTVDPATWQIGTSFVRSSSIATVTVPGITTSKKSLVLALVGEATTATTNEPAGVSIAAPFTMQDWYAIGGLNSVMVATQSQSAAGATGNAVATYPNASANAAGVLVAIPTLVDAPVVTHLPGRIADDNGTAVDGTFQLWDGTNLVELASARLVRVGRRVSELHANAHVPVIAHRLGSLDYAEHSMRGATECALLGVDALEFSVAITSDGKFFGLHDATLDRTTPSVSGYDPKAHTWAEIQQLMCSVGDAAGFGPQPYILLDDLVAAYGRSHTLVLDPKVIGSSNLPAFYAYVQTIPDYRERVVLKYFHTGTTIADAARSMGVKSWGYSYTADVGAVTGGVFVTRPASDAASTAATAAKWDYLGLEYTATQDAWTAILALAAGKPVWGHICPTSDAADTALAKGATGLMVSGVRSVMQNRYYDGDPIRTEFVAATESFPGADGAAWPAQWTTVADNGGSVDISGGTGRIRQGAAAWTSGALAYLSGVAPVADSDITAKMTFTAGVDQRICLSARVKWAAAWPAGGGQGIAESGYSVILNVSKGTAEVQYGPRGGNIIATFPVTFPSGGAAQWRYRLEGKRLSFKLWTAGSAEPTKWDYSDLVATDQSGGTFQVSAQVGNYTTVQPVTLDDLTFTTPKLTLGRAELAPRGDVVRGNVTFRQTFVEDFATPAAANGPFGATYARSWQPYRDEGIYFPTSHISAHESVMDVVLDGAQGSAGSFGTPEAYATHVGGKFSMRAKALGGIGNGTAVMVWPSSDIWADGEIDYPESNFEDTPMVHHHSMTPGSEASSQDASSDVSWRDWHVYSVEWIPGVSVKYYVDDVLLLTVTTDVPTTPHRYMFQVGPDGAAGHLYIDWVATYDLA